MLKAVVVATVVIVGAIALIHPVIATPTHRQFVGGHHHHPAHFKIVSGNASAVTLPGSVISGFFLLSLAFLVGARFAVQLITDGRVRSVRVGKGVSRGAGDRRR